MRYMELGNFSSPKLKTAMCTYKIFKLHSFRVLIFGVKSRVFILRSRIWIFWYVTLFVTTIFNCGVKVRIRMIITEKAKYVFPKIKILIHLFVDTHHENSSHSINCGMYFHYLQEIFITQFGICVERESWSVD